MTMLSREERAVIRDRADKATKGPWVYDDRNDHGSALIKQEYWPHKEVVAFKQATPSEEAWWLVSEGDAEFIAWSRSDIPALLSHADSADKVIEQLRETIRRMLTQCPVHAGTPCPGCIAEAALAAGRGKA